MRRFFLIMVSSFFLNCCFCQDTSWKDVRIDSFLSVSLPGVVIKKDTALVRNNVVYDTRAFKAETEFAKLAITAVQTDININPYQIESGSMQESYEGVKYGFKKKAEDQGFTLEMKDTIVNFVRCFKANIFTDDHKIILSRMSYNFCVNSLIYSIIAVPVANNIDQCTVTMNRIINSIRFDKKEILAHPSKKNASDLDAYQMGVKIGELLFPVLLIGGIVTFFVYRSRKRSTKSYRQN